MDFIKNTVRNLFTTTTNIRGGILWKKSSETFKQNPLKIPKKKVIFSKATGSNNKFIHAYFSRFLLKV